MPTVARLNVTPVKSTRLHNPDEIRLERFGAAGNRDFFFVNERGRRFSGGAKTPLLPIVAEHDAGSDRLRLRLPDGVSVEGSGAATGDGLSVDFYGRTVAAHVVDGDFGEALSRYAGTTIRLARVDTPGAANDVHPVTLVSLASVEELSRRGGRERPVDSRRFRMLIELDGCSPHEEDAWAGRRVRVGEAVVVVGEPVPRCVVTTLDPATGKKDFETLKVIRDYRGRGRDDSLEFGVYAEVERPGAIRVGDAAELLAG